MATTVHRPPIKQLWTDPVLRRFVAASIVLGIGLILSTFVIYRNSRTSPPWAEYINQPAIVGVVNLKTGIVTRAVGEDGVPVTNETRVQLAFIRCGPPVRLEVESQRTWEFRYSDGSIDSLAEPANTIVFEPNDECTLFQNDTLIPDFVLDIIEKQPRATVLLRFNIQPSKEVDFSGVVAGTEYFRPGGVAARTEEIDLHLAEALGN